MVGSWSKRNGERRSFRLSLSNFPSYFSNGWWTPVKEVFFSKSWPTSTIIVYYSDDGYGFTWSCWYRWWPIGSNFHQQVGTTTFSKMKWTNVSNCQSLGFLVTWWLFCIQRGNSFSEYYIRAWICWSQGWRGKTDIQQTSLRFWKYRYIDAILNIFTPSLPDTQRRE